MSTLFVEQLTVIDCAFLDPRRGLVGESWIVDIELEGELDDQSMVLDFSEVKKRLKRAIDASVDHTLVVPLLSPALTLCGTAGHVGLQFSSSAGGTLEYASPVDAVTFLDAAEVTVAALQAHLQQVLSQVVPKSVAQVRPRLRNESIDGAYYHYTHGLKKHAGQCQRIAHGHRSRVEVRIGGVRDPAAEQTLAARWRDIYIGTRADVVAEADGRTRFAYTAAEGDFVLELPTERCDFMDADTTVERIAEFITKRLAPEFAGQRLEVRAYEGVMKGAIARA